MTPADADRPEQSEAAAMTAFTMRSAEDGHHRRLTLSGDLDIQHADEFVALGRALVQQPGVRSLEVDLAAVTFLDSTGIGALIEIRNSAKEHGCHLALSDPAQCVRDLLRITGLDTVFSIKNATTETGHGR